MYPNHKTPEDKKFFEDAVQNAKNYGITVIITDTKSVNVGFGTRFSGYFSAYEGLIKVAGAKPNWFEIFVHEYCHFLQFITNSSVWRKNMKYDDFDSWIAHEVEFSDKVLDKHFKSVRNLELDCERRSAKMIKKHKLSINLKRYIQTANAYIFFYTYLRKYRKWYKGKGPTNCKKIYQLLPTVFLKNREYNVMPTEYERLTNSICF